MLLNTLPLQITAKLYTHSQIGFVNYTKQLFLNGYIHPFYMNSKTLINFEFTDVDENTVIDVLRQLPLKSSFGFDGIFHTYYITLSFI